MANTLSWFGFMRYFSIGIPKNFEGSRDSAVSKNNIWAQIIELLW